MRNADHLRVPRLPHSPPSQTAISPPSPLPPSSPPSLAFSPRPSPSPLKQRSQPIPRAISSTSFRDPHLLHGLLLCHHPFKITSRASGKMLLRSSVPSPPTIPNWSHMPQPRCPLWRRRLPLAVDSSLRPEAMVDRITRAHAQLARPLLPAQLPPLSYLAVVPRPTLEAPPSLSWRQASGLVLYFCFE